MAAEHAATAKKDVAICDTVMATLGRESAGASSASRRVRPSVMRAARSRSCSRNDDRRRLTELLRTSLAMKRPPSANMSAGAWLLRVGSPPQGVHFRAVRFLVRNNSSQG